MSGGSYNYLYYRVLDEYQGHMYDKELDIFIKDLCVVLHDLEWWQSADICEESYRETVKKFKKKWFKHENKVSDFLDAINKAKKEFIEKISECEGNDGL